MSDEKPGYARPDDKHAGYKCGSVAPSQSIRDAPTPHPEGASPTPTAEMPGRSRAESCSARDDEGNPVTADFTTRPGRRSVVRNRIRQPRPGRHARRRNKITPQNTPCVGGLQVGEVFVHAPARSLLTLTVLSHRRSPFTVRVMRQQMEPPAAPPLCHEKSPWGSPQGLLFRPFLASGAAQTSVRSRPVFSDRSRPDRRLGRLGSRRSREPPRPPW